MLLLALAITQGLGLLLTDERNRAVRAALELEAGGRAANVVLLPDNAPADVRPQIPQATDSPLVRFEVGPKPEAPHDSVDADLVPGQIRQTLGEPEREVRSDVHALSTSPVLMPNGLPAAMRPMHEAMMAVVLVACWTARRVVGPMRARAVGADRLGRRLDADSLPMAGPSEVRATTQAFNRMQNRLIAELYSDCRQHQPCARYSDGP